MKILHITFSLINGGKENMLVDIANEQHKLGYEVAIVVINDYTEESITDRISETVSFYTLKRKRSGKNPWPFLKLFYILRKSFQPHVIHSHDHSLGKLIKKFSSIPIVLTVHGPGLETDPMFAYSRVFAISNSVKKDVKQRGGPECRVLYNGIKTGDLAKREKKDLGDEFKIVTVKRLNHERKGQDLLIKAADILVNNKGRKEFKFYLVGDGESRPFLEKMIEEYKIKNHVFLLGNWERERVYAEMAEYDLFVHPSRYEGFGLTVAEAMAAKVPVIASDIEGPAEILDHGKYGLLFENENVEELVEKILQAEKMYADGSMQSLIESAYEHCIENFDIARTAKQYCQFYPKTNA